MLWSGCAVEWLSVEGVLWRGCAVERVWCGEVVMRRGCAWCGEDATDKCFPERGGDFNQ